MKMLLEIPYSFERKTKIQRETFFYAAPLWLSSCTWSPAVGWNEDSALWGSTVCRLAISASKLANKRGKLKCLYWCLIMIPIRVIPEYIQTWTNVWSFVLLGLSTLTHYWVRIDSVDAVPELKHKALGNGICFTLNFTCDPRQSRACYVIPPVSFSKPVQGPLQRSWTNSVWHDPCWYVVRVRHYNRSQTYAILAMDHYRSSGGIVSSSWVDEHSEMNCSQSQ